MQSSDINNEVERYIDIQGEKPPENSQYPNNSIISSKYTKLTFLPKTLFAQFISIPKLWFLLISIFELSGLSTITLPLSTILPLALLIFLDLVREAFNDHNYHKSDKVINSQLHKVWDGNCFIDKECKDIIVGDIILLLNSDVAPADMIVLCVGNEEHECYADVSSVIGESNLKVKHPVKDVQAKIDCLELEQASLLLKILNSDILISPPCKSFKKFSGRLKLGERPRWTQLDSNNLLLRGMRVQNTPWMFGVAAYTGIETKVWINNLSRPQKVPRLRKIMEKWILWMLVIGIVVSIVNTLIFIGVGFDGYRIPEVLIGNLVLFNHFVQISLYLSIELVRIFTYIYNFASGPIQMKNFDLFSNLGMIEYIVTDKTGTLTDNYLDISLLIIDNNLYLNESADHDENCEINFGTRRRMTTRITNEYSLFSDIEKELKNKSEKFDLFFICLAICNLSFPVDDGFVAISEDDKVLARTASRFGYSMLFRSSEICVISINDQEVSFEIIGTQAFSSDTKKSRIIVRRQDTSQVYLFVKGNRDAMINIYDHTTYERNDIEDCIIQFRTLFLGWRELDEVELKTFVFDYDTALLSPVNRQGRVENVFLKIEKNVAFLGIVGLEDVVSEDTKDTVEILKKAGIKFWVVSGDAEESTLTAAVAAGIFQTEKKIVRLGGYSSELDCMKSLQEIIKENIFSNKVIERNSVDSEIHMPRVREVKSELNIPFAQSANSMSVEDMIPLAMPRRNKRRSTLFTRDEVHKVSIHPLMSKLPIKRQITSLEGEYNPKALKFILSIDSSALEYGMSSKNHQKYFTSLLFTAKAVCFHGLLPDQKSKVARIIKHNFRFSPLVLSVGDGVSDIGMIQVSDIGVGIRGKEGSEASLNADVSIEKFSQLKELILNNGHRHYIQFSKMILLSVYVMILFESTLIFYAPINGWTAGSAFFAELMIVYRLVINIFPVACMCILDSDCTSPYLTPKVYKAGIFNSLLNLKNLAIYVLTALIQAGFTFLSSELYFTGIDSNGMTENYLLISVSLFYILSTTVFITILIETYSINYRILMMYILCIIVMILSTVPLTKTNDNLLGYASFFVESSSIWVYLTLAVLFNSNIAYMFKAFRYIFVPSIIERVRLMAPSASFRMDNRLSQYKKTLHDVYRESGIWVNQSVYDDNAIDHKKLKFQSNQREQLYQTDKLTENAENFRILLTISGVSMLIYSIYNLSYEHASTASIAFHITFSLLMLTSTYLPRIMNFQTYSKIYLMISFLYLQAFYLISQIVFNYVCLPMLTYLPVVYLIGFSNFWLEMTLLIIPCSLISGITLTFTFIFMDSGPSTIINVVDYFIVYISICIASSLVAYHIDKSKREEFVLVQKVQVEINKRNSVLSYLLPAFVMKRVVSGIRYISDNQGVVSIIFCDIHNFESILRNYNPQELAAFFDEVYARLDQICMLSGCTKIETVGKTYLACAGLKDSESELDPYFSNVSHARRCIEMGLSIIRNSENIYLKNREVLKFNIGINSGPVTAGVVGFHKPQFSLVGDTINTASRMASLCPRANVLQISSDTMELVGDKTRLIFEESQVTAKGKGLMKTFLVSVPEANNIQSPVKNQTLSGSISEMFSLKNPRKNKSTKKITLYQISNQHRESDKRKSSLIEELENQVAVASEFVKRKTMGLQKVKVFSLGFTETRMERKFREKISENTYPIVKYGMILRIFSNTLVIILIILRISLGYLDSYEGLLKLLGESVVLSVLVFFLRKNYRKFWYCWVILTVFIIGAICRFTNEDLHHELVFVKYIYHLLQAAHCSQILFKNLKLPLFLAVVTHIIYSSILRYPYWILQILASLIFFFTLLYTIYTRESKLRVFKILKKAALKKIEKSEALLAEMMPKHAYENLKDYISVTESITNVTLLYADIVGFTAWASNKRPEEVVNMLSELFQEFDRKCKELEVYKVHTIGDCYVAMGYTGVRPRNENVECYRMAQFGLSLVEIIQQKNKENNTNLNMRIGMHTGNIIGGIIGTSIVRYDIYGIDVHIANKMESEGTSGSVKVSEATKNILYAGWPKSFTFDRDNDLYASVNNSRIKTFILKKNFAES